MHFKQFSFKINIIFKTVIISILEKKIWCGQNRFVSVTFNIINRTSTSPSGGANLILHWYKKMKRHNITTIIIFFNSNTPWTQNTNSNLVENCLSIPQTQLLFMYIYCFFDSCYNHKFTYIVISVHT